MRAVDSLEAFDAYIEGHPAGPPLTVFGLDLTERTAALDGVGGGSVFIGCRMSGAALQALQQRQVLIVPEAPDLPFEIARSGLYSVDELYDVYDPSEPESYVDTRDARIFDHWRAQRQTGDESLAEAVCRHTHDGSLRFALSELIEGRRVVGLAGSHELARDRGEYRAVAELAWALTRRGYLCISGGGPGTAEATSLGAYFADRALQTVFDAIEALSEAPDYQHPRWLTRAFEVQAEFPAPNIDKAAAVALPCWQHEHELPSPFTTHIGKYFTSSARADGLGTIATAGVIFAPGSVDTIREVFTHAGHFHNVPKEGHRTPMLFFGDAFWSWKRPVVPLLKQLAGDRPYGGDIHICDDVEDVLETIDGEPE